MVFPNAERVSRTTNPAVLKCNMLTLCDDLGEGVQEREGMQETRVLLWGGGFGGCIEVKFVKFGFFVSYSRMRLFFFFPNIFFCSCRVSPGFRVSGIGGYHRKDH